MIAGTLVLEDHTIVFTHDSTANTVDYTISDGVSGYRTSITCPAPAFLAALGIALHHDGDLNAERDYPEAESVQPFHYISDENETDFGKMKQALRWIP